MSLNRLLGIFRTAGERNKLAGRRWYQDAFQEVHDIADSFGERADLVAALVAVLSPNNSWQQNLDDACTVLEYWQAYVSGNIQPEQFDECKVSTYDRNKVKAFAIVYDTHENERDFGEVRQAYVRGPKVSAFYRAIMGERDVLVLDSHCVNAWYGRRIEGGNLNGASAAHRRQCANDYVHAASVVGETVSAFQAIVWLRHLERIRAGRVPGYTRIQGRNQ
jgi:hypothetical protein